MQSKPHKKAGYTLVELLAVISIMGILSGMGVVGFQSAVANARTKDSALNVAAYLEMVANKARQINDSLCVRNDGDRMLKTYRASCASGNFDTPIDSLVLDAQSSIITSDFGGLDGYNLVSSTEAQASFIPRPGLSTAPYEGYIVVKYGDRDLYAAAVKERTKNVFISKLKSGSDDWSKL
ncbi:MAG: prepilin-type N-terminal cleavage/methylation domain-containing protein [Fibrobacter sp.]|nr:prepilin-type N-terminal cleavage/methylation domain-containing protein [Fibrobacter sp.]MBR3851452.1 prepilin-type N-terminal cleavage/methylation domain-containing protein [Fibrobacter sp.]